MLLRTVSVTHLFWQIIFYGCGLVALGCVSLWTVKGFQIQPIWSFENYRAILNGGVYRKAAFESLWLASSTAALAVMLGVPLSYAVMFHVSRRFRLLIVFALFLPFFSSYVMRMFAWQSWMTENGVLGFVLKGLGIAGIEPRLIYTLSAVRIGLLSVLLPIATITIYLSMSRMGEAMVPAARNLGASSGQTFRYVIWPYSLPGITTAFVFGFIIAFGDFIAPSILGGNQTYLLSTLVDDRVKINDWPGAAALGTLMLVVCVTLMSIVFSALGLTQSDIRKIWSNIKA